MHQVCVEKVPDEVRVLELELSTWRHAPHRSPQTKDGAKTPKRGRNIAEYVRAPCQPPNPPHPSRFNLEWAQNRESLVDLFTLNRQAGGQNHGVLYSLIYGRIWR